MFRKSVEGMKICQAPPFPDMTFPFLWIEQLQVSLIDQFVSETLLEVQKLIPHATQDLVEELTRVILVCLIILYP